MHVNENTLFHLDFQNLKLLRLTVKKEMHFQVYTIFDLGLGSRSHKTLPSTSYIM